MLYIEKKSAVNKPKLTIHAHFPVKICSSVSFPEQKNHCDKIIGLI